MARKKQFKAVIQDQMLFEDLIWMSVRYCIGRKTIAASTHARNLVSIIHYLSKDRREFMAMDIRREINSQLNWKKNIIVNDYTFNPKYDAYTLLCKHLENNPDINDYEYDFTIDVNTGIVTHVKRDEAIPDHCKPLIDLSDYTPWIKLANYLDENNHFTIKAEIDDKEIEMNDVFEYIDSYSGKILYTTKSNFEKNSYATTYIAQEYIKEIIR